MAIKYVRSKPSESAPGTQGRFDRPMRDPETELKRKLILVYLGIIAFTGLIYVVHSMGLTESKAGSSLESVGIVIEKAILNPDTPDIRYVVVVEVSPPEQARADALEPADPGEPSIPPSLLGQIETDEESWRIVETGLPVRVTYTMHHEGRSIRITQLALIPSSEAAGDVSP